VDDILLKKGVKHAASLWREEDGTIFDFSNFVKNNYIADPEKRKAVFRKVSGYFESLLGNYNEITLDLKKNLDEATGDIDDIDRMFGTFSVSSHLSDDFYANKIAFFRCSQFSLLYSRGKRKTGTRLEP